MGYDFWGSIFRRLLGRRCAVLVAVLRGCRRLAPCIYTVWACLASWLGFVLDLLMFRHTLPFLRQMPLSAPGGLWETLPVEAFIAWADPVADVTIVKHQPQ